MANICVIGAGYAGLVTAACLADMGHRAVCLDVDAQKVDSLAQGVVPFFEPGLEDLVQHSLGAGRLRFTCEYADGLQGAGFIFIAVNTPSGYNGKATLKYVMAAARGIGQNLDSDSIVITKSTVPVGTAERVAEVIKRHTNGNFRVAVVSNPEFLCEGTAAKDFLEPARIVIGGDDPAAATAVAGLYEPLGSPIIVTDSRTAEMFKYAHNAFLAVRVSFINEIASICESTGADVRVISNSLGLDRRVGQGYLSAGLGFGGSCLPKDVAMLVHTASALGARHELLRAALRTNNYQREQVISKLSEALGSLEGKVVGLLGLAFKPNTSDIRSAPSLYLIHRLLEAGSILRAYDPCAGSACSTQFPTVRYCSDPYAVAIGCDALVLVTEWEEFRRLDMARIRRSMRQPVLVDGRNLYDSAEMARLGFRYRGIGVGTAGPLGSWRPGSDDGDEANKSPSGRGQW